MILKTVHIQNFKCITDSTTFRIDRITCLVGKNESGKTAILQALEKLKPVVAVDADFESLEFPRMTYNDYSDADRPKEVITTTWELEDADVVALEQRLGVGTITERAITLQKGYDNELLWSISIDLKKIVQEFIYEAKLYTEESQDLADIATTGDLISAIKKITSPSERQTELLNNLTTAFPEGSATATACKVLQSRLPIFLYFGNYEAMKGEVSLEAIASRRSQNLLEMPNRIFLALLDMAGTNVDAIQDITRFEPLIAKLEGVSNHLTREIFRYWSQNRHLEIDFRFDAARPNDPPPLNSGYIFRTRVRNKRHGVTVSFDERSSGFVWFFSFLVWFSQVKKNYGDNLVLLLDEPGLTLHAKAQGDLLRYMNEKLVPHHQVIFTTHSPFMVDANNLLSVRTVEDVVKGDDNLGTNVGDDVLSTDKDTIFPLQAALGYDIAQSLFVGEHVLLVEGPSDLLYLQWASDQLRRRRRAALDRRWVITPAGSIDKIGSFIALFGGNKLHVAVLTDLAQGDKNKVQRLREHDLLKAGHVFTADAYAGQAEADVEDLLGRPLYVALVNTCYGLSKTRAVPSNRPATAPIRVTKEIEQHFATLPPSVPEFDHYTPARYLLEHSTDFVSTLPDPEISAVLDRFEALFTNLNGLLTSK